jgi:hypothetical protein
VIASRRRLLVAAILLLALVLRVWDVQHTSYKPANDAQSYLVLASQVAHTGDYSGSRAPGSAAGDSIGPTAYFPPRFTPRGWRRRCSARSRSRWSGWSRSSCSVRRSR